MARRASQWIDDDPSCGEQEATPHPISVYSKLNDCQVKATVICHGDGSTNRRQISVYALFRGLAMECRNLFGRLDTCPRRNFGVFCNHYNTVAYKVEIAINVFVTGERLDQDIVANPHILIENRAFDMAIFANANRKIAAWFFLLVIICPHQYTILNHCSLTDLAANTDNGMRDLRLAHTATLRDQDVLQLTGLNGGTGQKTSVGIDRCVRIIKIEGRVRAGQLQVGFVERADGPDVLPVAVEVKAMHPMGMDRFGNDLTPKVVMPQMIGEQ